MFAAAQSWSRYSPVVSRWHTEACDMRKGFEGLLALVGTVLKEEVKSGTLCIY
jgi:hypothetical protein